MRIASFNIENLTDRPGADVPLAARLDILRPQLERLDADILCCRRSMPRRIRPVAGAA